MLRGSVVMKPKRFVTARGKSSMDFVTVENLSKAYRDFTAVNDISFAIKQGEIFGFLGPNGSGKTSTINMIIGLSRPTNGRIIIDGIDAQKETKRAQSMMGIVADESNLYDEMDGFENLCFCASLYGMKKAEREEKAKQLLKKFGLDEVGKRPFKAYSKGMRRKLTIAAGIIHSPQILFLDEPTTGIDVESARQIRELILELKNQSTIIFMTTHYTEDAERICDRIAFIVAGKIVSVGTVTELMKSIVDGYVMQLILEDNMEKHLSDLGEHFAECNVTLIDKYTLNIRSKKRIPLFDVIKYLKEKEVDVLVAKELRPSLEDVFVKVTGIELAKLKKEKEKRGASN